MKLARKFNVNPKTIAKWKKHESPSDLPLGPEIIKSTVLCEAEERTIVAFRHMTEPSAQKMKFKQYPIGYFHIDIVEVRTAEGKLYLYVANDRTSKFTYAELHPRQTKMLAAHFLRNLIHSSRPSQKYFCPYIRARLPVK